ncbi:TPA: hypothetical protein HA225_00325 [Candidatus Micrarchaeota archaeon]|nr:hypothetical protein [Candidatus Micrarchaeota archaeon]
MRFWVLAAALFLALIGSAHAGFTYLYSINGSNPLDSDDFYKFYQPTGLLYEHGKLYVADGGKNALYILNGSFRERVLLSTSSVNPFDNPLRMTYENGTLYIADGISTVVKTYNGEGFNVLEWNKKEGSNMEKPSGVALDERYAYITDNAQGRLYLYSRENEMYARVGIEKGGSDGLLQSPADVEIYHDKIFISDQVKGLVFAYDSNLSFLYTIGRGLGGVDLSSPRGIEIFEDRIYVADSTKNSVFVFTLDGFPIDRIGAGIANGSLSLPEDVAIGDGKIFVADTGSRRVLVYELNRTVGNDTVKELIDAANRSLAQLYIYAPVAAKLNLSFSEGSAALELATALTSYDNFMFTDASALAQKSLDQTVALQLNLTQAIELRARQLVKAETGRIAPFRRPGLEGAALSKLTQFDNMASDINAKLSGKAYGLAADAILELPAVADEYIALIGQGERMEEEREANRTAGDFGIRISALRVRLERLGANSAKYRQNANLTGSQELLAAASGQAAAGEYDSANSSIGLAEFEISSQEAVLRQAADEIDKGLANISLIEFGFNAAADRQMLFPPDLAGEKSQMLQAKDMVYTNPLLAVAMASKAAESAVEKSNSAQAVSTAAAGVLVMLALIGLIALVFSFHIYSRRKKMREEKAAREEPKRIIWKG